MAVIRVITSVRPALEIPIWNASSVTQTSSYNSRRIVLIPVLRGNSGMRRHGSVRIAVLGVMHVILLKCVRNAMTIIN